MRRLLLMFLMLGLLSLAGAGCGDDDDDDGGGSDEPAQEQSDDEGGEAAKLAIELSPAGEGRFEYDAPESIEAGLVEIEFTNSGEEAHEAQLIRIEEGGDAEEFLEAIQEEGSPTPDFAVDGGGVGSTDAGETATVTQVLEPGKYLIFDSETTEGQGEGEPFYTVGGQAELEVTGEASDAELPETDARVVADEYSFETEGLKAGENTFTFENAGDELHHAIAFPIQGEATIEEVTEFFESEGEGEGPPPLDFESGAGTAVIDGGVSQVATFELESGRYAFVCFISDRAGGPPHVAQGMITEVEVP